MKILNANEITQIAGGANPGHNDLGIAIKEGALTALLAIPPFLLMAYGLGATIPTLAFVAGAGFELTVFSEVALAYFDVSATYIFYPNNTANSVSNISCLSK